MENKMKMYSPSTGGFYEPEIHGKSIPADAVEVSEKRYQALFSAQSSGKVIQSGVDGQPVETDPPELTGNALILSKIAGMEASITPRRIRESVLGFDGGWLKAVDEKISDLRKQIY